MTFEFDSRTKAQQIAIAIIPKVTGSISFVCSSIMVHMILRSEIKLGSPFRRLIFAMCIVDMLQSGTAALSTLSSPKDSPGIWGAYGNTTTCNITGSIFQFASTTAALYVSSLCIHYFCFVQYKVRQITFRTKIEPFLHGVPILWSFVGTVYLTATGNINQADVVCWIAPLPYHCINDLDIECIRGENSYFYRWIFAASSNSVALTITSSLMFQIYIMVSRREIKLKNITQHNETKVHSNDSVFMQSAKGNINKEKEDEEMKEEIIGPEPFHSDHPKDDWSDASEESSKINTDKEKDKTYTPDKKGSISNILSLPTAHALSAQISVISKQKTNTIDTKKHKTMVSKGRSKEAVKQATLFTGSFGISYAFVYITGTLEALNIEVPYYLRICLWIFFPLQGFFNIFVFTRPHVAALMRIEKELTTRQAIWKVIKSGGDIAREARITHNTMKRRSSLYLRSLNRKNNALLMRRQQQERQRASNLDSFPLAGFEYSGESNSQHRYPKNSSSTHSHSISNLESCLGEVVSALGLEGFDEDFDLELGSETPKIFHDDDGVEYDENSAMYGDFDYDIIYDDDISFSSGEKIDDDYDEDRDISIPESLDS
jgi:hypothetical protein